MVKTVAFLGLGVMGYPMAGHLAKAGYNVQAYNRTKSRAESWLAEYEPSTDVTLSIHDTPAEAAKGAEIVFACVGNDNDIRAVTSGVGPSGEDGAFSTMSAGSIFVDHTTASADVAKEMAAAAKENGLGFLDAPVSGGEAGAQNGALTVMVGGSEGDYAVAAPVMQAYAKMQKLLGPVGAGQTAKMVNQICIAATVQGLAEALHFAMEAGLDANAVVDVISKGAAQSWQMENRAPTMIKGEFDFGFAVDWMRKDLGIVMDEAKRLGVDLPVTKLVDGFYAEVQEMGGNRNDTSSLIRRFRG